jgi:hypothetical protein
MPDGVLFCFGSLVIPARYLMPTHWVSQENNNFLGKNQAWFLRCVKPSGVGFIGIREHAWHRLAGPLFPVSPHTLGLYPKQISVIVWSLLMKKIFLHK